ncbi:MAG: 50S ribosomal protein L6 [Patescibacteria group bacterium]
MSRIGKKQIEIPSGVELTIDGSIVRVKGAKGELFRDVDKRLVVTKEGSAVTVSEKKAGGSISAIWGTYASHIINMIEGVSKGFTKKLEIQGIGFKAEVKGDSIVFNLGFSHQITMKIPKGLAATIEKGIITIDGIDKEVVGAFAANVRDLKKPEPYKGKGIRYVGEHVAMKQGKKTV